MSHPSTILSELLALRRYAPLVPIALAAGLGLVLDRVFSLPAVLSLAVAIGSIALVGVFLRQQREAAMHGASWMAVMALAAAHHHGWRHLYAADEIGNFVTEEPLLVRLRGVLLSEPTVQRSAKSDPWRSLPRPDRAWALMRADAVWSDAAWKPVRGQVRLSVDEPMSELHVGDEVELLGWLQAPLRPLNPGELHYAERLLDQRIRAEIHVRKTALGITRLQRRNETSLTAMLAQVRGWGQRLLAESLPEAQAGVAVALLLGESSAMTREEWEPYVRTGVIHVLAISGQHLVILSLFLAMVLRVFDVRWRSGVIGITLFLLLYALLAGGRPSVMRAAVMVAVFAGAVLLRRRAQLANTYAFAFLVVLIGQPTDLFTAGFQLSFLAVAVLLWGVPRWIPTTADDPVQKWLDESRSPTEQIFLGLWRGIKHSYAVTLILWLATFPLILAWQNLLSPIAVILGPPMILLTSIALIAGFLLLLVGAVLPFVVPIVAFPVWLSLWLAQTFVEFADGLPGAYLYLPSLSLAWMVGFYLLLAGMMVLPSEWMPPRRRWQLGVAWMVLLPWSFPGRTDTQELTVTFLAVGHGGCTVIETADGRVLLYDAGAISGPGVTKQKIAPFLWSKGILRIDEVFLSHGDLDHFNGLPELLRRFSIGQVTTTPSFADKQTVGVEQLLRLLEQYRIPIRIAQAGDCFQAGSLRLEVLHPSEQGPSGPENRRSLVLRLVHLGHTILLTGDLESTGMDRVIRLPIPAVDVVMVPHHGSRIANKAEFVSWCKPRLAVSCEGPPQWPRTEPNVYQQAKVPYWGTWPLGAITLRSHRTGLVAETFSSGERLVVHTGSDPE